MVEPPVLTVRVGVLPKLQRFDDVIGKRLIFIVLVLFVYICCSPIFKSFKMLLWWPVGYVVTRVVDIAKRTLLGIIQFKPLLPLGLRRESLRIRFIKVSKSSAADICRQHTSANISVNI